MENTGGLEQSRWAESTLVTWYIFSPLTRMAWHHPGKCVYFHTHLATASHHLLCRVPVGPTLRQRSRVSSELTSGHSLTCSGLPWWLRRERNCLQCRRPGFSPWVRKRSWRRKWQPTPVFLLREFHEQRSLGSCSPWGLKESDTTE